MRRRPHRMPPASSRLRRFRSYRLSLSAADGHRIPALHYQTGAPDLVLLSHGITGEKDEGGIYRRLAEEILAPAFDSIRFDFRGHGESRLPSRQATVAGEMLDFMAVNAWALGRRYRRIHHVAASFGASVTLLSVEAFRLRHLARTVFLNPVIDYRHTFIDPTVPWARTFFRRAHDRELALRRGTRVPGTRFVIGPALAAELAALHPERVAWPGVTPLLVLHGDCDTYVPHADARRYARRNAGVKFRTIAGAEHGFAGQIEVVFALVRAWLSVGG